MTRSRSRAAAKAAGTRTETATARYLAQHVDRRIERRRPTGAKDRGDISGLHSAHGHPLVVECKNWAQIKVGPWLAEARVEAGNADALAGVVVAKRYGTAEPGKLLVMMTLADLVALITGVRPSSLGG